MIARSVGKDDQEFFRNLINDHPIGDEHAVLRGLLDDKVLGEVVGPQHTKSSPGRGPEASNTKTQESTHDIATDRPPTKK